MAPMIKDPEISQASVDVDAVEGVEGIEGVEVEGGAVVAVQVKLN